MASRISIYDFGGGGVNRVKNPLQLADNEALQLQNAELVPDEGKGGLMSLTMRGGFAALNGSALAGSVLGIFGWPLKTTFTKTLYAGRQTEDTNTFKTTTNGTTWTDTATPEAPVADDKFGDNSNVRTARRGVTIGNYIVYASNNYTQDTDNPEIAIWDDPNSYVLTTVPIGPSSNGNAPFVITDMLTVGSKIYFAVSDPGGTAPNLPGRVLELNVTTGKMRQIASAFGGQSGEVSGGAPACLAFYKNQLWVGVNGSTTTDGIGKIVRCFPDIDTAWTTDVSNLRSHIVSLAAFKGNLYAATRSSVSAGATITRRSVTAGTWATQATSTGGAVGNGHYASFVVDGTTAIYAVEYHETTPIINILRSTDGTTWSTDRDVDTTDGGVAGNFPGSGLFYSSELFYVFRSTAVGLTNGFVMKRTSGGTWSKVDTDNFGGPLVTLVKRV